MTDIVHTIPPIDSQQKATPDPNITHPEYPQATAKVLFGLCSATSSEPCSSDATQDSKRVLGEVLWMVNKKVAMPMPERLKTDLKKNTHERPKCILGRRKHRLENKRGVFKVIPLEIPKPNNTQIKQEPLPDDRPTGLLYKRKITYQGQDLRRLIQNFPHNGGTFTGQCSSGTTQDSRRVEGKVLWKIKKEDDMPMPRKLKIILRKRTHDMPKLILGKNKHALENKKGVFNVIPLEIPKPSHTQIKQEPDDRPTGLQGPTSSQHCSTDVTQDSRKVQDKDPQIVDSEVPNEVPAGPKTIRPNTQPSPTDDTKKSPS
ncbi:hypothetical protein J6590_074169 [Homalodisca vitripennis]|nr:hypothetical protein J6590_074169 [Homalodisca vitripennis]